MIIEDHHNKLNDQSESTPSQPIEDQIIGYLKTLEDNHELHDKKWFKTLLEDCNNNLVLEISKLKTIINTIILDSIAANLLNNNPLPVIK